MSALHVAVLNAFKSKGWAYREIPGMEVVEASFEAYHTRVPLHVQSFGEMHILAVVANASVKVPNTHRVRAAELCMRVNKELNIGAFEMDWDAGQVMFRQANVFAKHRHDEELITNLVHNAVVEMDRMTPYLGELCRTTKDMLPFLDLQQLLKREELLPPGDPVEADAKETGSESQKG